MRNVRKAVEQGKAIMRDNPHRDLNQAEVRELMGDYEHPTTDGLLDSVCRSFETGVCIGYEIGLRDGMRYSNVLGVKDVAEKYNVATRTIHRWMRAEHPLPYSKFAGVITIKLSDVEQWAEKYLKRNPDGTVEYKG